MTEEVPVEAAALLRRILEAVKDDRLDAVGPSAGVVRQIQGAAAALEALVERSATPAE